MIVSHKHKYFYIRVPKTGSTSVTKFILDNLPLEDNIIHSGLEDDMGISPIESKNLFSTVDINPILIRKDYTIKNTSLTNDSRYVHAFPSDLIKTKIFADADYSLYSQFAVCRDPVERFKSRCAHFYLSFTHLLYADNKQKQENYLEYILYSDYMFKHLPKQSMWLTLHGQLLNNAYLYEDLPKLVEKIAGYYNCTADAFTNYKFRKSTVDIDLPSSTISKIKDFYAEDFDIRNRLFRNRKS